MAKAGLSVLTVNIEYDHPPVHEAEARVELAVQSAKLQGHRALKIIHGYGSSGKGGAIRTMCRRLLSRHKKQGRVKAFCGGEDFSPFSEVGRDMIARYPALKQDRDWGRENDGITIALL